MKHHIGEGYFMHQIGVGDSKYQKHLDSLHEMC